MQISPKLRETFSRFCESPLAVVALLMLIAFPIIALLAPWIAPQDPYDLATVSIMNGRLAPGETDMMGNMKYWLGTDEAGRDMLSAIIYGLRISIGIGLISALVGAIIGSVAGLMAAHFGGRVDTFIMRLVDLQLSFPAILIALVLLATLGQGIDKVIIALIAVQWAYYARTVRSVALSESAKDYVAAARSQRLSSIRIMFWHILPNCLAPLLVILTVQTAHAITLEATLSFLGLGLPKTQPSLGLLISNGFEFMLGHEYWIAIFPGIALLLLILSINIVSDRLRDIFNPRMAR